MILFVGDTGEYLAESAKALDPTAFLIDSSNVESVLDGSLMCKVAYTSVGDLPKMSQQRNVYLDLLLAAQEIRYVPPDDWGITDDFQPVSIQTNTEYPLMLVNNLHHNVQGLDLPHWRQNIYVELADERANHDPHLWIAGCSIANGFGVEPQKRFGHLVSQRLNLPVTWLTRNGTGIPWAADQILRSDLRPGDVVIWGLTSEFRYSLWSNGLGHHTLGDAPRRLAIDGGFEHMLYRAVTGVHSVINFCEKARVKLVILPVMSGPDLGVLFHDCPHWYLPPLHPGFLDLGDDGRHPGPQQHREWAEFCCSVLETSG